MPTLGERLKHVRENVLGISQAKLAARLEESGVPDGTTNVSVMRYEKGDREPSAEYVRALAALAGVDAGWLLTGEGEEARPSEAEEWTEHVLQLARYANGYEGASEAEALLIKRDILVGCIKLGRMAGKDVRALEEELERLGGPPAPRPSGPPTAREIYELIAQEGRIADKRTDGLNALIEVARIEAEESRERRLAISSDERGIAVARQGHLAVQMGRQIEAAPDASDTRPAPVESPGPGGTRPPRP